MRRAGERERCRRFAATCVAVCTLAGCAQAPETDDAAGPRRPDRVVDVDFEHEPAELGGILTSVTVTSAAQVTATLTAVADGHVTLTDGVGGGYGLRFPRFDAAGPGAAAAVVIRSGTRSDLLSPGEHDFGFGADFSLDATSDGTDRDNGNNLVQRGLTADADQYKIQVDHRVPSCRVAGDAGVAFVESGSEVLPQRWYRIRCRRTGDHVVLSVAPRNGAHWGRAEVTTVAATTGNVDFADPATPLSVGAKVDAEGGLIASSSDQFNGVADNVFFEVAR